MLAKFLHFIYVFVRDRVGRLVRDVCKLLATDRSGKCRKRHALSFNLIQRQ